MEILSQSTGWFEHLFLLTTVGALSVFMVLGAIGGFLVYFTESKKISDLFLALLAALVGALLIWGFALMLQSGPPIEYKAIVTDWNAVYDAGYEVVGIDGKIVTLRKD